MFSFFSLLKILGMKKNDQVQNYVYAPFRPQIDIQKRSPSMKHLDYMDMCQFKTPPSIKTAPAWTARRRESKHTNGRAGWWSRGLLGEADHFPVGKASGPKARRAGHSTTGGREGPDTALREGATQS